MLKLPLVLFKDLKISRELGVELLLLRIKRGPAEVVQASDQEDSWTPPFGDFLGTSNW